MEEEEEELEQPNFESTGALEKVCTVVCAELRIEIKYYSVDNDKEGKERYRQI